MAAMQQVDGTERRRKADGDDRAEQRAGRAAGADEAEETLALLAVEQVGHERPEHRDCEEAEHADPDEEDARHHHRRDAEGQQQPEQREIGDEEMIDDGDEPGARQLRHQGAVERLHHEQSHKGGGEHPRQGLDAAGDAHPVAQRPQDVVARQQHEEIGEGP